jgi:hypothetical protein
VSEIQNLKARRFNALQSSCCSTLGLIGIPLTHRKQSTAFVGLVGLNPSQILHINLPLQPP